MPQASHSLGRARAALGLQTTDLIEGASFCSVVPVHRYVKIVFIIQLFVAFIADTGRGPCHTRKAAVSHSFDVLST